MSRDIFIKPNRGATGPNLYPEIAFSGTSSITPIKLKVDDDGSVLFTGTYGVLFNISDNKDGLLHSVNDISGLPILSVYSYDYVQMGKWDKNTLVVNSDLVGVGLTAPSTKLHIYATSSGAFRLQDGTETNGYVLTSDADGVGTWQPPGVSPGGSGLTGTDNGLSEITTGVVGLGGTLIQNTIIDGGLFDLSLGSNASKLANFYVNIEPDGSVARIISGTSTNKQVLVDVNQAYLLSQDSIGGNSIGVENGNAYMFGLGTGGNQVKFLVTHNNPESIDDGSTNNYLTIRDEIASKGLVYISDYSANFTTHSLVTKGYVKSLIGPSVGSTKTVVTRGFTASITETITHNLNTTDIIVQNYDSTGLQIIAGSVLVTGTGSVDITFSQTLSSVKTILIG